MGDYVRLFINPIGRVVEVKKGTVLLEALREAGIWINSICGGHGECGKCKVILNKGEVLHLSNKEDKWLSPREKVDGYLLACQVCVLGNAEFTIPIESQVSKPKILVDMESIVERINPACRKYLVETPVVIDIEKKGRLGTPFLRLKGSDEKPLLSEGILKRLLSIKDKEEAITATLTVTGGQSEVIAIEPGDSRRTNYGLAIDIGTTTIVALLVDLTAGKILGRASCLNGQINYGETLVTRIAYARRQEGLIRLQKEVVKSINAIIEELTLPIGIGRKEIAEVCVGGNTVMNHLLAGIDPSYLAYVDGNEKVSRNPIVRKASELGIDVNPEAYIYCLPNVSRFLGGDAIGDVLASGMHKSDEISLLIDLGTNGEIILGNNLWLISASCASGPAFEGEGIGNGMRAMEGAIEHVKIDPRTLEAECEVIGNVPPKGICGSGIIDTVAEMFSAGIIDFRGKIVQHPTSPFIRRGRYGLEYILVPEERTAIGRDIVINQRDMDYIIDSKAAVCGAVITLMRKLKLSIHDVRNLYLAGAFGAYTDLKNVMKFGILPEFPRAKVHPIGNGSLSGAYAALLSIEKRREMKEVAEKMLYIDLSVDYMFTEAYSDSIYIPGPREFFPTYASR
ncbi:DUF4445 domain-containing protein [Candidatus Bathyarchaeota archaeon]|nr:DUF4445 domain-containing protein [Candidatus Bathyarchaeota archaeon]